ncbi:hypothetical protein CHLRE_12g555750v5 [Chlamydomonas reinhardtii]|uniref:Carbohydrate kinase PfkB domain-containing protein n=1 Tax=Chlamydomonas reinhardtii TaxID=3055 RepID=A8IYR4_CHLRE|nr:uncharacterized protein CHLRE_12g555750v5 [Chlamydomonas reinhardtii]PNW75901.1 hypothetical protein CHLRE_12g555750v5 [Chlamydomonas reinhardtii]|eukprot:XP_001694044.1 predicted protein [Chlamydomonas reinhardtii]
MKLWSLLLIPLVALIGYFASELTRVDLLLVGTVTIDVVDDGSRPAGGAVSYAASIVRAYGIRACVVTVAGEDADLTVFNGHELHVVPAPSTLTFEHTYTWFGHQRKLRVTANPNVTLSRAHVPRHCQRARTVILGPLTQHELDAGSFLEYDGVWDALVRGRQYIGLMAQGFQRRLGPDGRVLPLLTPSPQLLAGLGRSRRVSLFLSDVETEPWAEDWLGLVVGSSERVLITRGSAGATEYNDTGVHDIHIVPVDKVRDTNGAGDTFATGYMLALSRGLADPGAHASWAASRAVMQPQSCKPHCAGDLIEGHMPAWGAREKLVAAARGLGSMARGVLDRGLREGLAAALHLRELPPGTLTQMAAKAGRGPHGPQYGAVCKQKAASGAGGGGKLAAGPEEDDDDEEELASMTVATVTL